MSLLLLLGGPQRVTLTPATESDSAQPLYYGGPYRAAVLRTTGVVSLWPEDDASGNALDAKGPNPGEPNGSMTRAQASFLPNGEGKSVKLEGGWFTVPDSASMRVEDTLTLEAWIYCEDQTGYGEIFSGPVNGPDWYLQPSGSTIRLDKQAISFIVDSTVSLSNKTAYHVALTKTGATVKVYVNGADKTGAVTNATLSEAAAWGIGAKTSGANPFKGRMAFAALYNVALSKATIEEHYVAAAAAQRITLTAATEADSAQALSFTKPIYKTATAATETDSGQSLTATKHLAVGTAAETDSAQGFGAAKHKTATPATETDAAVTLSFTKPIHKALSAAVETEAAIAASAAKRLTPSSASETDAALALTPARRVTLSAAAGSSTARSLSLTKLAALTLATETDSGQSLSWRHIATLAAALETDAALELSYRVVGGPIVLLAATEADQARSLAYAKPIRKALSFASETDAPQALDFIKPIVEALVGAGETDAAIALSLATEALTLSAATEADSALRIVRLIAGQGRTGQLQRSRAGNVAGEDTGDASPGASGDLVGATSGARAGGRSSE